jgi:cell division septation protein DedD
MPRNEEGEFELVLGNRQLLSVFFIVVVLLGVFFVMGYILGKNSSPVPAAEATVERKTDTSPAPSPIIIDKSAGKSSAAGEPVKEKAIEVEKPVSKTEAPPEPKVEEKKPAAKEPVKEAKKEAAKPAPASAETQTGAPPKGSLFMQVAAVGRAEADVVAKVLRGKGYKIWIAPTEKDNIFRVLVGPIQASEKGKTREELDGLGFKPFPRTY